jgi:hypothetical protein
MRPCVNYPPMPADPLDEQQANDEAALAAFCRAFHRKLDGKLQADGKVQGGCVSLLDYLAAVDEVEV